jgi:hypothetical protein
MARTANADREAEEAQVRSCGDMSEALELANELAHVLGQIYRRDPRMMRFTDTGNRLLAELVLILNDEQQTLKQYLEDGRQKRHSHHYGKEINEQSNCD